jgi:hypothetical protein
MQAGCLPERAMKVLGWSWLLVAAAAGAEPLTSPSGRSILLDNRCDPDEWQDAARRDLGEGVVLRFKHDAHHAYLCLTLPPESLGAIDLYLQSDAAQRPWNLHASAQLGEKQRGADGWPPDWTWGNERGWYSPAVPFRGLQSGEHGSHVAFGDIAAREIQLSRVRFGPGPWRLMFELHALGPARSRELRFPAAASIDASADWQELAFARE